MILLYGVSQTALQQGVGREEGNNKAQAAGARDDFDLHLDFVKAGEGVSLVCVLVLRCSHST
jgi:hypothetical protein